MCIMTSPEEFIGPTLEQIDQEFLTLRQASSVRRSMLQALGEGLSDDELLREFQGHAWYQRRNIEEETELLNERFNYYKENVRDNMAWSSFFEVISNKVGEPAPDTTIAEYFGWLQVALASNHPAHLPFREGVQKLLGGEPEKIDEFVALASRYDTFVRGGKATTSQTHEAEDETFRYRTNTNWWYLIATSADVSRDDRPQIKAYRAGFSQELPTNFLEPGDPRTVWRRILLERKLNIDPRIEYRNFIFGPDIADKDTEVLMEALEQLEDNGLEEFFANTDRNVPRAVRYGYDTFRMLINEAANAGWSNAEKLKTALADIMTKRPGFHGALIHLGNLVTEPINKSFNDGNVQLRKQRPTDIENTEEAINRCIYAIFELGQQPKGKDPLNYLITAQITATVFAQISEQLRESGALSSASAPTPALRQAQAVRDIRQASPHDAGFWKRWKAGYGILS